MLALQPGAEAELLSIDLSHYTDDLGKGRLAAAVANLYSDAITEEDVVVLSGVDAVIMDTMTALVEPGACVSVQSPEYPPLRNVAEWRGGSGSVTPWLPCSGEVGAGWDLSVCATAPAQGGADVIVATLPHSPFGWSPSEEWLQALVKGAAENGQTLIVDEIYRGIDLTDDGTGLLPSACELSETAVVFGGLAKTYGLTGQSKQTPLP